MWAVCHTARLLKKQFYKQCENVSRFAGMKDFACTLQLMGFKWFLSPDASMRVAIFYVSFDRLFIIFIVISISVNKLKALIHHYKKHGLAERRRKSGGRRANTTSLSYDDLKAVVTFISNFAEEHALVLPGRVPGFKRADIKLLPSSETKASVWRKYKSSVELLGTVLL